MPSDAVQQINGQDVVFVRTAPDRFAVRPVRVGETTDGKTPILEGTQGRRSGRRARQLHSEIATSEIDAGKRVAAHAQSNHRSHAGVSLARARRHSRACSASAATRLYTIPVEAFPDLTNNQVVVVTEAPSLPPTEVEQLVTYPIERAMLGLPNKEEVRSLSKLGLSMVTVVFDDSVPMYFARQLVSERLQQISSPLPRGMQPHAGTARDRVRRAVPVHALRPDERDGAEGSARVGDQSRSCARFPASARSTRGAGRPSSFRSWSIRRCSSSTG